MVTCWTDVIATVAVLWYAAELSGGSPVLKKAASVPVAHQLQPHPSGACATAPSTPATASHHQQYHSPHYPHSPTTSHMQRPPSRGGHHGYQPTYAGGDKSYDTPKTPKGAPSPRLPPSAPTPSQYRYQGGAAHGGNGGSWMESGAHSEGSSGGGLTIKRRSAGGDPAKANKMQKMMQVTIIGLVGCLLYSFLVVVDQVSSMKSDPICCICMAAVHVI